MRLPPERLIRQHDTHRLIPSRYSHAGDSVLVRVAEDDADLPAIFDLDNATNDRLLAEDNRLGGVDTRELVFAVPYYRIINAAFCHAQPLGSRFNGPDRGAWYAAFDLETAQAEVAFHKAVELAEVGWEDETVTYDDYLADFSGRFHDIRAQPQFKRLPIIALTAKAMQDDQQSCIAAGANDYIAKPLDVERLLSLLRVWLPR